MRIFLYTASAHAVIIGIRGPESHILSVSVWYINGLYIAIWSKDTLGLRNNVHVSKSLLSFQSAPLAPCTVFSLHEVEEKCRRLTACSLVLTAQSATDSPLKMGHCTDPCIHSRGAGAGGTRSTLYAVGNEDEGKARSGWEYQC